MRRRVGGGAGVQSGSAGGTGIALYRGALFAEADDRIVRYALPAGGIAPTEAPATIVSGLPLTGDHPMHPFAINARGTLYVNLGSATNSCQVQSDPTSRKANGSGAMAASRRSPERSPTASPTQRSTGA